MKEKRSGGLRVLLRSVICRLHLHSEDVEPSSTATYLVENGAVAMEQRGVADVRVTDHPAEVRRRPPDLRQVPEGKIMCMIRLSVLF